MSAEETSSRGSDLAAFGAVIGAIYETALDPLAWPAALEGIRGAVGGAATWIATHYPDQIRSVYQIEVGTDPAWQQKLRDHYVAASPFMGVTHHVQRGDVVAVGDVIEYDEFVAGRFYREWAAPQGWPDIIMAVAAKSRDRFSWLGICLPARATPAQKAMVTALLPHVSRALRISDVLEARDQQAADLLAAVESMASGMILIDGDSRVRGINTAARRLLSGLDGLTMADGRLILSGRGPAADLAAALTACAAGRIDKGGVSVLIDRDDDGAGIVAHVMPLSHKPDAQGEAVAALFLTDPAPPGQPPMDSFVARYGLTPSETRVLLAMLEGKSPRAIAIAQGVGMPTVRTHLSRLYAKTGTNGQAAVVRLATSLTRPV